MNLGEIFTVNLDVNFNDSDLDFGTNIDNFNFENMGNFDLENIENFDFGNIENFNFGNMDIDTVKFNNLGVDTPFNPEQPFNFPPQPSYFDTNMVLPVEPLTNHSSSASTSNTSILNTVTLPKSNMDLHAYCWPMKCKKVDDVDATHILPEGLQCCQTKIMKAAAALE